MHADVAEARGAQHRIAERVQHHVAVAVRDHTARVRNAHAAEDHRVTGSEGMYVESRTDAHQTFSRSRSQNGAGEQQIVRGRHLDVIRSARDQSAAADPSTRWPVLRRWACDPQPAPTRARAAARRSGTPAASPRATVRPGRSSRRRGSRGLPGSSARFRVSASGMANKPPTGCAASSRFSSARSESVKQGRAASCTMIQSSSRTRAGEGAQRIAHRVRTLFAALRGLDEPRAARRDRRPGGVVRGQRDDNTRAIRIGFENARARAR